MPGYVVRTIRDIHFAGSVHTCILEKIAQDGLELHKISLMN
jgi:hypothetical protein